jgi:hypothetical protein
MRISAGLFRDTALTLRSFLSELGASKDRTHRSGKKGESRLPKNQLAGFLAALLAAAPVSVAAQAQQAGAGFDFRLAPGPRLVGTRADSSGSGQVHALLQGNVLTLQGTYQGLLGKPTEVHLAMGSLPGVRGPVIASLAAGDGTISGRVTLNARQLAAFRKGGLYVEIDSAEAPDGDLWGWVLPPSD